jgi:hypothetical protein
LKAPGFSGPVVRRGNKAPVVHTITLGWVMKKQDMNGLELDYYLGCFGNYNRSNTICKKFCAVNIRCAIEQDQNVRIELIEDLVASEDIKGRIH